MKNKKEKKNPVIDKVCLGATLAIFGAITIVNIIQPNRPTYSEAEKRPLETMPKFSLEAVTSGKYFSDVSLFVSDTFAARDSLVGVSKKIENLRGASYSIDGENDFVVLRPTGGQTDDEGDRDLADRLAEALDVLGKQDPKPNDPADTDDKQSPIASDPTDGETTEASETVLADGSISEKLAGEERTDILELSLTKSQIKLTVGSGAALKASVDPRGGAEIVWSTSDKSIAEIGTSKSGGINVKATGAGTCYITCRSGEYEVRCEISVSEINSVAQNPNGDNADFLPNGLLIYGDAVYTEGAYSEGNAKNYLDTALYYKTLFGEKTNVSVIVAPVSSMVIDNPKLTTQLFDQSSALKKMANLSDPSVNFVDVYSEMYDHKDEYLFFKTDHHWTARGAYYAYSAYAKSVGLEPTPLDGFDFVLKNDKYQGSMYQYTQNEIVKTFYDSVEAFIPRKEHTMTITTRQGTTETYNSSVVSFNNTYVAFIAGDNPYTVINVPENPQDKNVLVLKDSFGNGLVPFLVEHYGNIYVVDVRYAEFNIYDQLADAGITDIIFINNIQAACSGAWSNMYLSAVGVR